MATVIGAPCGDDVVMTGGDDHDQVVITAGPTQEQQQVHAVLASPFFHGCMLALILCQIITSSIHVSIMAAGQTLSWSGPVMLAIALLFLSELGARMFVAGGCRCARTFYGKVDAFSVISFSWGAVLSLFVDLPGLPILMCVARVCRVDLITRSATWFLPRWGREIACLLIVFPLSHLIWATLAVLMLHPVHEEMHKSGDSAYDREAFGNVGSAMIHMLPYNWGIFEIIIRKHIWTVAFFGVHVLHWVLFFGRAVVNVIRAYRAKRSQEQERALAEALWSCELQMTEVCTGGQTFQDGRTGAERSQGL